MQNPMSSDQLTALFRRSVDTLFLENPVGTSLGIFLGLVLQGAFSASAAVFGGWVARAQEVLHWWTWVAFGIFGFNLRPYLRRHKLDPALVEGLEFIKQQERDKTVPKWQIRAMYQNLFTKVLERLVLEPDLEERLRQIHQLASSSSTSSSPPPGASA
jgi:hypothetical protein